MWNQERRQDGWTKKGRKPETGKVAEEKRGQLDNWVGGWIRGGIGNGVGVQEPCG